jgi:CheY-like chemotaxis protein
MLLRGKTIFIVEDNVQNRIIFQMALVRHGAITEFERRGPDALFRLASMPQVDLIILDLMLTDGVSGFDVFDQIRALEKYADIPIIAVSAMDPSIAVPRTRAKGFAGFIAKPINTALFAKQLADVINGTPVWYVGDRSFVS